MAEERLFSMKRVSPKIVEMDTVKEAKQFGDRRAFHVLMEAQQLWDNMSRFRLERERNKPYTYGDQWGDIIHVEGEDIPRGGIYQELEQRASEEQPHPQTGEECAWCVPQTLSQIGK